MSLKNSRWQPFLSVDCTVVERLVYSNQPESYAGGDFISLDSLTKPNRPDQRRGGRQSSRHYDYLTEMVGILKMVAILNF